MSVFGFQASSKFASQAVSGGHNASVVDAPFLCFESRFYRCGTMLCVKLPGKPVGHVIVVGDIGAMRQGCVAILFAAV